MDFAKHQTRISAKDVEVIFHCRKSLLFHNEEPWIKKNGMKTSTSLWKAYSGTNESGELYKGLVSFMITGLKKNIPYVVQSIPEVTFTGRWLAEKISECIQTLHNAEFSVRGVVTDDHSTNVNAFTRLRSKYKSKSPHYFNHPSKPDLNVFRLFEHLHILIHT